MSLSVCLLTRNQRDRLTGALRSLEGVADEVIVADAASTDGTAAVAAAMQARVCPFRWEDDFAAGRNFAMAQAVGDWVLWFNADEELLPDGRAALAVCLRSADTSAFSVHVHNVLSLGPPAEVSLTTDVRLYRRRPDLRFVGRCHPRPDPALVERLAAEGLPVRPCRVAIRSFAPLTERTEGKLRWTARLLERELIDRPGQLHYLIELGQTLLALKDPRGPEVLFNAAVVLALHRNDPAPPTRKAQVLLEHLLTRPPGDDPLPLSPEEVRTLALRWFGNSPPLLYLLAEQAFEAGQVAAAAELLRRLLVLGRTGDFDRSRIFAPGLVGEEARVNLAACYLRLGDAPRAAECYESLIGTKHEAQARAGLDRLRRGEGEGGG